VKSTSSINILNLDLGANGLPQDCNAVTLPAHFSTPFHYSEGVEQGKRLGIEKKMKIESNINSKSLMLHYNFNLNQINNIFNSSNNADLTLLNLDSSNTRNDFYSYFLLNKIKKQGNEVAVAREKKSLVLHSGSGGKGRVKINRKEVIFNLDKILNNYKSNIFADNLISN